MSLNDIEYGRFDYHRNSIGQDSIALTQMKARSVYKSVYRSVYLSDYPSLLWGAPPLFYFLITLTL